MQNTGEVNLAATYSGNPTPCPSSRGSYSSSGSTWQSRGNKENEGGTRSSKNRSQAKDREKQTHTLLGEPPSGKQSDSFNHWIQQIHHETNFMTVSSALFSEDMLQQIKQELQVALSDMVILLLVMRRSIPCVSMRCHMYLITENLPCYLENCIWSLHGTSYMPLGPACPWGAVALLVCCRVSVPSCRGLQGFTTDQQRSVMTSKSLYTADNSGSGLTIQA